MVFIFVPFLSFHVLSSTKNSKRHHGHWHFPSWTYCVDVRFPLFSYPSELKSELKKRKKWYWYCWPSRCMNSAMRLSTAVSLHRLNTYRWLNRHSKNSDCNTLTALATVKDLSALQRITQGGWSNTNLQRWLQERSKPSD